MSSGISSVLGKNGSVNVNTFITNLFSSENTTGGQLAGFLAGDQALQNGSSSSSSSGKSSSGNINVNNLASSVNSNIGMGAIQNLFGDVFNGNQTGIGDVNNFLNTSNALEVGNGTQLSQALANLFQGSLGGNFSSILNGGSGSNNSVGLGAVGNLFGDVFNGNQTGIGDVNNFLNTSNALEVGNGTQLSKQLAALFQ